MALLPGGLYSRAANSNSVVVKPPRAEEPSMRNSTEQDRPLPAMKNNWLAVEVIHQRFVVAEDDL
jgi:hypothetical protein